MSMSSLANVLNAQWPSSNTSTLTPSAGCSTVSRRPVVIWTGSPISFREILWRAASAWMLVIPGMISHSKSTVRSAEGTVVKRRVSPYEKGAAFVLGQLLSNRAGVQSGAFLMPRRDRGPVRGGVAIPLRVLDLDDAVGLCLHVALADLSSGTQQFRRVFALVGHEDHVHLSEGVDGLNGDVVGVAGSDPDEL
jgi:hypothetical protein